MGSVAFDSGSNRWKLPDSQTSRAKMETFTVEVKTGKIWGKANKENLEQLVQALNSRPELAKGRKNDRGLVVPLKDANGNIQYKVTPAATQKTAAAFSKAIPQRQDAEFLDQVKKGYCSVVDGLRASKAPVAEKSLKDALDIAASQNNKEMTTALIKLIESREQMGSVVESVMRDCIKNEKMNVVQCIVQSCKPKTATPLSKMMTDALANILLEAFKENKEDLVKKIMGFGIQPREVVYQIFAKEPPDDIKNLIKARFGIK